MKLIKEDELHEKNCIALVIIGHSFITLYNAHHPGLHSLYVHNNAHHPGLHSLYMHNNEHNYGLHSL